MLISCYKLGYIFVSVTQKRRKINARRRRVYLEHPSRAMNTDEIITFKRKLSSDCQLKHKYFAVIKTSQVQTGSTSIWPIEGEYEGPRNILTFYAKRGRFPTFRERPNPRPTHRYENQIAIIRCSPGWIHQLIVFQNAMLREENGTTGQYFEVPVNAQGCGIGVILTELCLIDQEIYTVNERNRADNLLTAAGTTIHQSCEKLVGLNMAAVPPSKGHVYFSAAMRRDYTRLLIDQTCAKEVRFNAYETALARQKYDDITGEIEECAGYGKCQAYRRNWYFCDK